MSRMDLAKEIDFMVSHEAIRRYEMGGGAPSIDVTVAILRALKITLSDIMENE